MSSADKIELAWVPVAAFAAFLLAPLLPGALVLGSLLLVCAVLLLVQSLLRDLWLLSQVGRGASTDMTEPTPCMCAESMIGVVGVVAGLLLIGLGSSSLVSVTPLGWGVLVLCVTGFTFAIKDVVIEWNPWRIRRDRDHVNLVFSWKRRASQPERD